MLTTLRERVLAKIEPGANGCWQWVGYIGQGGCARKYRADYRARRRAA